MSFDPETLHRLCEEAAKLADFEGEVSVVFREGKRGRCSVKYKRAYSWICFDMPHWFNEMPEESMLDQLRFLIGEIMPDAKNIEKPESVRRWLDANRWQWAPKEEEE